MCGWVIDKLGCHGFKWGCIVGSCWTVETGGWGPRSRKPGCREGESLQPLLFYPSNLLIIRQGLEGDLCFPRPCRGRARRLVLACEFGVGETLPGNLAHGQREAVSVGFVLAIVETENLFVNVAIQMERFHSNVGSTQSPLEQTPEVFQPVRMDAALYVGFGMVHNVMDKAIVQLVVAYSVIGVDGRTVAHIVQNFILQSLALHVRYNLGADLSHVAVKNTLHNRLADEHSACVLLLNAKPTAPVHILRQSTNECFIGFQFAARTASHLAASKLAPLHNFTDALKHEPCRLLMNANRLSKFVTADPVLAVCQHPKRCHPLVQRDWRIFHDSLDLYGKLLLAVVAEPDSPRLDERMLRAIAARTGNLALRPAQLDRVVKGPLRIGEVDYRFLEGCRSFGRVHDQIVH